MKYFALSALAAMTATVSNAMYTDPLIEGKLDLGLVINAFHERDHLFLNPLKRLSFKSLTIPTGPEQEEGNEDYSTTKVVQALDFEIFPNVEDVSDWDMTIGFDPKEFLGVKAENLAIKGNGLIQMEDGTMQDLAVEGTIDYIKFSLEDVEGDEEAAEVDTMNFDGNIDMKQSMMFDTMISDDQLKITTGSEHLTEQQQMFVYNHIRKNVHHVLTLLQEELVMGGNAQDLLTDIPLDLLMPVGALWYAVQLTQDVTIEDNIIHMGLDPLERKLMPERIAEELKPISHKFFEPAEGEAKPSLSIIVDENVLNTFIAMFTTIEQMFSLKEQLVKSKEYASMADMLTTDMLNMVIPGFTEEYGEHKSVDIIGTMSSSYFQDRITDAKKSAFQVDKNGNVRLTVNFAAQIIVETSRHKWEDVRSVYVTAQAKGKMMKNKDEDSFNMLEFMPKSVEIQNVKIFRDDETLDMEQMLVQSLINNQLDAMKTMFVPIPLPLPRELPHTPEFECVGVKFTSHDLIFNGGFYEYVLFSEPASPSEEDSWVCEAIQEGMKKAAKEAFDQLNDRMSQVHSYKDTLDYFKDAMDEMDSDRHVHDDL